MALQGNIRDFSVTQLLNLINLSKRSGMLSIHEGLPTGQTDATGEQEVMRPGPLRGRIAFDKGRLIYAEIAGRNNSLIAVLHKTGKLTDKQARLLHERAGQASDKALAMRLISARYATKDEIIASIRAFNLDLVYSIMAWDQGPFRFEDGRRPIDDRILVPVGLENVIIEGARRIREAETMRRHIENLDMALRFTSDNPKEKFRDVHLGVNEWKVVGYVNPKNSIRQIMKKLNMSEMEIRRIVFGLEQAGLVELVRATGGPARAADAQDRRRRPAQVQPQVVNRLIERLRSL
jgi:DNA-binding MarR family transcriptional regulator